MKRNYALTRLLNSFLAVFVLFTVTLRAQAAFDPDTVKAQKFDTGKMWSFDYPPYEYLKETYGMNVDEDWMQDIRLSALRVPGCTSSFVSADGLMMTNHHCAEGLLSRVQKEGENLEENGFYAATLADERPVPNYYADQLVLIQDVSDEVLKAGSTGETNEEKTKNKEAKINELVEKYKTETGLNCQIVSLFNGGKYSIYGYKRYTDIRLVFVPDKQIAYFGGDFDNFTYPRYNLDCSFLRAYENGKPVNSEHFFKFTLEGIKKGEPIFTVGNPGRTQRLKTVAQLEYYRDFTYRNASYQLDTYYNALEKLKSVDPARADEFEEMKTAIGNAQKVYHMTYVGLADNYLMARKKDFQRKLQEKVWADTELKKEYGHVWEAIERTRSEMREIAPMLSVYPINPRFGSAYFTIANELVKLARQLQKPEAEREPDYQGAKLDTTIQKIFPEKFDKLLDDTKLQVQSDLMRMNLGDSNEIVKTMFGNNKGKDAVDYVLKNSKIITKDGVLDLIEAGPDKILNSDDPFIYFVLQTQDKLPELMAKAKEINDTEAVYDDLLGQVIFKVYGTTIPPDANFTLRLSDGILKSFDYNGTIAPTHTTFFGLYDRYNSFDKQYPWSLHQRWQNPPADFDLTTPFNFTSTNDIVGGNSGSAVINKNAEVVGLAFDGNMNSIIGNFIYMPNDNRMVAVDARAMVTAFEKIYKATRLANELKNGKMGE